jgi:MFS family permease
VLPWTGCAADRFNQRKLLMAAQATMGGGLALALGALTIAGIVQLWHVYLFAFIFGAAAVDAPVGQTFVAELVGDADLPRAVSLNSTSFNAGRMVGPAAAGLVIAKMGTGWAFLMNGISFAAVLISMSLFRMAELRANPKASRSAGRFMAGLRDVWRRPDLRGILIMLILVGTCHHRSAAGRDRPSAICFTPCRQRIRRRNGQGELADGSRAASAHSA